MNDLRKPECQHPFCGDNCGEEPRGFLTEWEATPPKPTEDAKMKNDEAGRPMPEAFKDPHHLANTADAMGRLCKSWQGSTAEYHFACRDTIRTQAARIAELEGERDEYAAHVVEFSETAAELIEEMSKRPQSTWGQVKAAVRALGDIGDRRAYGKIKTRAEAAGE